MRNPAATAAWRAGVLATAGLGAIAGGCEIVAGIDDRTIAGAGAGSVSSGGGGGPGGGGPGGGGGAAGGAAGGGGAAPAASQWPDSATAFCTDGTTQLEPCPVMNQPYYGQDGSVLINTPSYSPEGTSFRDEVTGLVWRSAPIPGAGWAAAFNACGVLQMQGVDGFVDWRLPSRRELVSMIDYGHEGSIHELVQNDGLYYWTATLFGADDNNAWIVFNDRGRTDTMYKSGDGNGRALCVAGTGDAVAFAPARFVVIPSGAADPSTGLTWETVSSGYMDWSAAVEHCRALGGGWRLPSVKELLTLVDEETAYPAIDEMIFDGPQESFWTSTPNRNQVDQAWTVEFSVGKADTRGTTDSYRARCVL